MHMINDYVCSVLNRPIPDNRGKRYYTRLPANLDQKKVQGLPHIIFIAYYPDPRLLKKVLTLRSTGKVYTSLLAGCIREDAKIENYFDQYYEYSSFRELHEIVGKSEPHSWHAAAPLYHGAIVVNACANRSRLVIDVNDAAFFLVADRNDPSVQLEHAVMRHADCIVHKIPDGVWDILCDEYELKCGSSSIMSYPHSTFIHIPKSKDIKSPPHVVYAGGIIPYEIALTRGHENHIFDDLIELTGPGTFELSIYVNQNAREMPWHQHQHYFDFEDKHKYFNFKKGLPYYSISKALSQYDAGIFFDNISRSSYKLEHFKYNVSSKFFTYIEAGLPIVVYEEAEFMADLVREYNLGSIYKAREPYTIIHAIEEVTHNDYAKNIQSFCNNFSMEEEVKLLMEVHDI